MLSSLPLRVVLAASCAALLACSETPVPPPAGFVAVPTEPPSVEVTYIAGEGVLLSSGDDRVLIDGLHRPYGEYPHLPAREQELMETAQAPFDGIDLILVSHSHGDHFHAAAVKRYLENSPSTVLVSSEQVTDAVRKEAGANASLLSRITTITPAVAGSATHVSGAVTVQILGLPHGGSRWRTLQSQKAELTRQEPGAGSTRASVPSAREPRKRSETWPDVFPRSRVVRGPRRELQPPMRLRSIGV